MHRFVATGAPASPSSDKPAMLYPANQQAPSTWLLLKVTLKAEGLISLG